MSETKTNKDPMRVWGRVCKTDPKDAKDVKFGRKFTAITPVSQLRKATELWGPMGEAWGVRNVTYGKEVVLEEVYVWCQLDLYHPDGAVEGLRSAETLLAKTRSGLKADPEAWKKARTNAMSKGFAQLGFNADIFAGMWELPGYVEHRKREIQHENEHRRQQAQQRQAAPRPQAAPEPMRNPRTGSMVGQPTQAAGDQPRPGQSGAIAGQSQGNAGAMRSDPTPSPTPLASPGGSSALVTVQTPAGPVQVRPAPEGMDPEKWANGVRYAFKDATSLDADEFAKLSALAKTVTSGMGWSNLYEAAGKPRVGGAS